MSNPNSRAFVLARCPVTSSVKQSPSWDAEWPGNSETFLWYPAYHYRVHKGHTWSVCDSDESSPYFYVYHKSQTLNLRSVTESCRLAGLRVHIHGSNFLAWLTVGSKQWLRSSVTAHWERVSLPPDTNFRFRGRNGCRGQELRLPRQDLY